MSGEDLVFGVTLVGSGLLSVSIVGGIVSGFVRGRQRQRVLELIERERIALIERGTELDKLPSLAQHELLTVLGGGGNDLKVATERRRQVLLIAGLVFTFLGLGLAAFLRVETRDVHWVVGMLPLSLGLALLLASRLIKAPLAHA